MPLHLLKFYVQVNAEADSFACFVRLLSDSVDHFCQQLDNSAVGIHSTLSRLSELLKANDEELWRHLEISTKVNKPKKSNHGCQNWCQLDSVIKCIN